ncbi:Uncharacterised protein [Legionella beliardensis]|uniref:Uncharacterized protein n=1 Tax=Legionella beliardensis TaxID=91822 RepID=A0A378I1L5_9GAMM|nr:hypothetical protein [Legionella beliardensis]STX28575.1 Uncharacterised protein [Legionella beliardensis]
MHKLISILLVLIWVPMPAIASSQINVQEDENAQARCIQQFVTQCINKCEKSGDSDCTQLCAENAKNECRQAGE